MIKRGDLILVEIDFCLDPSLRFIAIIFDHFFGNGNISGIDLWHNYPFELAYRSGKRPEDFKDYELIIFNQEIIDIQKLEIKELLNIENYLEIHDHQKISEFFQTSSLEQLLTHKCLAVREFAKRELNV